MFRLQKDGTQAHRAANCYSQRAETNIHPHKKPLDATEKKPLLTVLQMWRPGAHCIALHEAE